MHAQKHVPKTKIINLKKKNVALNKKLKSLTIKRNKLKTKTMKIQKQSMKMMVLLKKKSGKMGGVKVVSHKFAFGKRLAFRQKFAYGKISKSALVYKPKVIFAQKMAKAIRKKPVTKKKAISKKKKAISKRLFPKKPSKVHVFNVYGKSGKKFVKLNIKPLTRNDALSKGTYAIDTTTSKTFKIVPTKKTKKAGTLRKNERNYFNRAGYKLREYKVRGGRKFALKRKFIERRRYGLDLPSEVRGLSIAKYLKKQRRGGTIKKTVRSRTPIKRKPKIFKPRITKRRMSQSQRKVMLRNLAKGRKVRMRNLRR